MKGSWDEFNILREVTTNANDDKWYRQNEMIQENTKMLCLLQVQHTLPLFLLCGRRPLTY